MAAIWQSKGGVNVAHQLGEKLIRVHAVVFLVSKLFEVFRLGHDRDGVLDQVMQR